jgi:pectate lyase
MPGVLSLEWSARAVRRSIAAVPLAAIWACACAQLAGCWSAAPHAEPVVVDPFASFCPGGAPGAVTDPVPDGGDLPPPACDTPPAPSALVGWATVPGDGSDAVMVDSTTGGGDTPMVTVSNLIDLNNSLMGTTPAVVLLSGTVTGTVRIGSNKTLIGTCGAQIVGHVQLSGGSNVIVRNLKMVGYNCKDGQAVAAKDCSVGPDTVTVSGTHHVWFDHDDISDGSDGNMDVNQGADYMTISWTKFYYSGTRVDLAGAGAGHQFSDLIGSSDGSGATDAGHLRVTFHHDWWGQNSYERMPRVRFGQIHLFNNYWSSTGNSYCVGLGVTANVLAENNVFRQVANPFNITSYANADSVLEARNNLFELTSGNTSGLRGPATPPPYQYTAEDPCAVVEEMTESGPR